MLTLNLETPVKIGEEEVKEINFDLKGLKGKDMIAAERRAKMENPQMLYAAGDFTFLLHVAAKAGNVPDYVLRELPAEICMGIIGHTANFFNSSMAAKGLKVTTNSSKISEKSV